MKLTEVQITHLRNLHSIKINLHPHITFISGMNGSGKTAILEGLYLLSCGRSFRAREIISLLTYGQKTLTVFSKTDNEQSISVQKTESETIARINGKPCTTSSELALFLPCQIFYSDIFDFINAGPAKRRLVLDWGLFHTQLMYYHTIWKDYQRVLKQRNALLKKKRSRAECMPWDKQLVELAVQLDKMRMLYVEELRTCFHYILNQFTTCQCDLKYEKGWDRKNEGRNLLDILSQSFERDCARAMTQYGAHHADLNIVSATWEAKHALSRGQQKIALFALKFAQAQLMSRDCLYLMDDFAAELDDRHIQKVLHYLSALPHQFILTGHEKPSFMDSITHSHLQLEV